MQQAPLLPPTGETADTQPRSALVIGNNNYPGEAKLNKAIVSAKAMAEALRGVGFEVIQISSALLGKGKFMSA